MDSDQPVHDKTMELSSLNKKKKPRLPSRTSWLPMEKEGSISYAKRRICARNYHQLFHHDNFKMELTIASVPGILGCKAGDSRYLPDNCIQCDANQRLTGRHNHNPVWHEYELDQPLTTVSMDVQTVTATEPYKGLKHMFWFGDIVSDYQTVFPTKRLTTTDCLAAFMYVF